MLTTFHFGVAGAAVLYLLASASSAHVTLEGQQAHVKSTYKAVLRVPHGCGSAATLKVRVRIPEGVIAVKPMPKAGWTLEIVKGKYAHTYDNFGTPASEGVQEITWTGKLLDENYEFVFRGSLTDSLKADTMLYFPTVQVCEDGKLERWIEIPEKGKSADDYKSPAPSLRLLPVKATN